MIKRVVKSELDDKKISETKKIIKEELEGFDFSKVIVIKPWGREYLTYKGEETDIWVLYIKKDNETSIHCHPNKKTSLVVLSGEVMCHTLNESFNLKEGDIMIFEKGIFHSTKAISEKGALIMELESPPIKTDLLRLKDIYGRELKGYEIQNEMCFDLSEYERTFINESDIHRRLGNMNLSIEDFEEVSLLKDYLKSNKNLINILIAGEIIDERDNKVYMAGDSLDVLELKNFDALKINRPIKIINIQKNIFDFD